MTNNPLTHLRYFIVNHYSLPEFRVLCTDLAILYDDLGGDERISDKADRLLYLLGQQRRYDELLKILQQTRPKAFEDAGWRTDTETMLALYDKLPTFGYQSEPNHDTVNSRAIGLDEAQALLDSMPIDEPIIPSDLPIKSRIPFTSNPHFTGRERELKHLAHILGKGRGRSFNQVVVVAGMGGIGKSQLAIEFAHRYGRFFAGGVYWLSFVDPASIPNEVVASGRAMGIAFEGLTLPTQVSQVRQAWQDSVPRLLIFDNCEEESLLAEWQPVTGGCRILVTSRRGHWSPTLVANVLPLEVLTQTESVILLRHFQPSLNNSVATSIVKELGFFPLALHLAGSFLAQNATTVSPTDYLLQLQEWKLLEHPSMQGQGSSYSPTGHDRHLVRTFALSYERLKPKEFKTDHIAKALLARAACFAPGEPIPRLWLLATIGVNDTNDLLSRLAAEEGLARLVELGLIEGPHGKSWVNMHPLLVTYVLNLIEKEFLEVSETVFRTVAQEASAINKAGYPVSLREWENQLRYMATAAAKHEDVNTGLLYNELGYYLQLVGDYKGAEVCLLEALIIRKKALGLEDPRTAETIYNLANNHVLVGNFRMAEALVDSSVLNIEAEIYPLALAYKLLASGRVRQMAKAVHRARSDCLQALSIFEELNDPRGIGLSSYILGQSYRGLGELWKDLTYSQDDSLEFFRLSNKHLIRAKEVFETVIPEKGNLIRILRELAILDREWGILNSEVGQKHIAIRHFDQGIKLLEQIIDLAEQSWPIEEAECLVDISEILIIKDEDSQAKLTIKRAENLVPNQYRIEQGRGFHNIEEPISVFWAILGKLQLLKARIFIKPVDELQIFGSEQAHAMRMSMYYYALAVGYFWQFSHEKDAHVAVLQEIYSYLKNFGILELEFACQVMEEVCEEYVIYPETLLDLCSNMISQQEHKS